MESARKTAHADANYYLEAQMAVARGSESLGSRYIGRYGSNAIFNSNPELGNRCVIAEVIYYSFIRKAVKSVLLIVSSVVRTAFLGLLVASIFYQQPALSLASQLVDGSLTQLFVSAAFVVTVFYVGLSSAIQTSRLTRKYAVEQTIGRFYVNDLLRTVQTVTTSVPAVVFIC